LLGIGDGVLGIDLAEHAESPYEFCNILPGHGVGAPTGADEDHAPAGKS
jgi:hypothetical protein